ncbi:MAG: tetratricopeptide repeat protein [candidate division Zixibacteria bacterium]|nr:tetratricopeptide repeat protein [candidate division Zixibacteria bacterium]NIR65013.1 tetratricopeptide repeat protein [candidate division Zixibacteria bacterium]NIS18135.1 tetratricopeptide repeat protein [candidate division Zixibacteria bacterium]NIS46798.1 tetratricopeptide repeat protein [candidate division Zixibacteria bacterium]NIT54409.1 tetratricopeptide repeat protein [candidate division Zixibacteria bacterium]
MKIRLLYLLTALSFILVSCSSGLYNRGKEELEAGNYQGAIAYFNQVVSENPDDAESWKFMGIAHYRAGNYGEAVNALKQAAILAPEDGSVNLFLGLSYERLGELEQAADIYRAFLDEHPDEEISGRIRHRVRYLTDKAIQQEVNRIISQEKSIKTEEIPDNTLAVLGFNPGNLTPRYAPLARGLSELLIIDLSSVPELKVVERLKLQAIMDEIQLTRSEYFDKDRVPRVGKLIGASKIVSGQLSQEGDDEVVIESGVIGVKDGFVDYPEDVEGDLQRFFALQKNVARNVLSTLGYELSPEEEEEFLAQPTSSFQAFLSYSLGLQYMDQGMYSLAQEQFDNALAADPDFALAVKAHGQVEGLSDYTGEVEPPAEIAEDFAVYATSVTTAQTGQSLRAIRMALGFQPDIGEDEGDNPYTLPVVGAGNVTINGSFDE